MSEITLYEERLDDQRHFEEVDSFTCGTYEPLNDFLKGLSFEYNRNGVGNTFLLFHDKDNNQRDIVCYYTLRANSLCIQKEYIPVVEISRFAVNRSYQRQGIGMACIINVIIGKVLEIKKHLGIVGILVFADTPESLAFYKAIGFKDFSQIVHNQNDILIVDDGYNKDCHVLVLGVGKSNLNEIIDKNSNDN